MAFTQKRTGSWSYLYISSSIILTYNVCEYSISSRVNKRKIYFFWFKYRPKFFLYYNDIIKKAKLEIKILNQKYFYGSLCSAYLYMIYSTLYIYIWSIHYTYCINVYIVGKCWKMSISLYSLYIQIFLLYGPDR